MNRQFIRSVVCLFGIVVGSTAAEPKESLPPGALHRLGSARFRFDAHVLGAAFGNDMSTLIISEQRYVKNEQTTTIRILEVPSGRERIRWQVPRQVSRLHLSPDGKRLLTDGGGWDFLVWDTETGKQLFKVPRQRAGEVNVDWLGSRIVVVASDAILHVYDADGREETSWKTGFTGWFTWLASSRDGKRLVAISGDGRMICWDAAGKEVVKFENVPPSRGLLGEHLSRPVFSSDGAFLAAVTGQGVMVVWEVKTGKLIKRIDNQISILRLSLSPDGRFVAAISPSGIFESPPITSDGRTMTPTAVGKVRVFGVASGEVLRSFETSPSYPQALTFSRDGKTLAAFTQTLHLWDLNNGRNLLTDAGHMGAIRWLGFLPDGRLASLAEEMHVGWWDDAGRQVARLPLPSDLPHVIGPMRHRPALLLGNGRTLQLLAWSPNENPALSHVSTLARPYIPERLSDDGRYAVSRFIDHVYVSDIETGKELLAIAASASHYRLAISRHARYVAFPLDRTVATTVHVWDVAARKETLVIRRDAKQSSQIDKLAFSPDARCLVIVQGREITLIEIATGLRRWSFELSNIHSTSIAFAPDGRHLVIGCSNGSLFLVHFASGIWKEIPSGHYGEVRALAFRTDGKRMASGGVDCTAIIWDAPKMFGAAINAPDPKIIDLEDSWSALGSHESSRSQAAVWRLSEAPDDKVVAFLRQHLKPGKRPAKSQFEQWVKDLDSEESQVRERAQRLLADASGESKVFLQLAMAANPSPEARRRIDRLLDTLKNVVASERVRELRSVEVLEHLGTVEARRLLEDLTKQPFDDEVKNEIDSARKHLASAK